MQAPEPSSHQLLVIVADAVDQQALDTELARRVPEGTSVRVIATPQLSFLDWLANDEDRQRKRADDTATRTAGALGQAEVTETGVGDADPMRAAEDAANLGGVDEVLIVFGESAHPAHEHPLEGRDGLVRDLELRLAVPVRTVELPGARKKGRR